MQSPAEIPDIYLQHVRDIEAWGEGSGFGFRWRAATVVRTNLVTVIHSYTLNGNGTDGDPATVIAVYTVDGRRVALWVPSEYSRHSSIYNHWLTKAGIPTERDIEQASDLPLE